jgi:hypothetical protein
MRLMDSCVFHYAGIVRRDPTQIAFLDGWLKRAVKRTET